MSKVPQTSDGKNPYIGKPISKTLLTPCRRVGLSRKIKTPSSVSSNKSNDPVLGITPRKDVESPSASSQANNETKESVILENLTNSVYIQKKNDETNVSNDIKITEKPVVTNEKKKRRNISKCLNKDEDHKKTSESSVEKKKIENLESSRERVTKSLLSEENYTEENIGGFEEFHKAKKENIANSLPLNKKKKRTIRPLSEEIPSSQSSTEETLAVLCTKNKITDFEEFPEAKRKKNDSSGGLNKSKKRTICPLMSEEENLADFQESQAEKDKISNSPLLKKNKKGIIRLFSEETPSMQSLTKTTKKKLVVLCEKNQIEEKCSQNSSSSDEPLATYLQSSENLIAKFDQKEPQKSPTEKTIIKNKKFPRSLSLKKMCSDLYEEVEDVSTSNLRGYKLKKNSIPVNLCEKSCVSIDLTSDELVPQINPAEIEKLETEVEKKRQLLQDLKQAGIYQKTHDVENLRKLTNTWKNGCISALHDLLPQLQQFGVENMDMAKLLIKLRVPQNLITLSPNGELI